jgi:hypothetical protein
MTVLMTMTMRMSAHRERIIGVNARGVTVRLQELAAVIAKLPGVNAYSV